MRALSVATRTLMLPVLALALPAGLALAKGLDELKDQNPENAENAADPAGAAAAETPPPPPGVVSKALADKLFVATSFGWVRASRAEGDWNSSGMSDVLVGYQLAGLGALPLHATYRYAPIAVTGKVDGHLYRGVWEGHHFGARFGYGLSSTMKAHGGAELGFISASLTPVDGLQLLDKHAKSGATLTASGGLDVDLAEKSAFTVGPRLSLGFGSFTIIQLGAAAGYAF